MQNRPCTCCGEKTLVHKMHDICPICGWEDDSVQNNDLDYDGGANYISLNAAKKVWTASNHSRMAVKAAKRAAQMQFLEQEAEEMAPEIVEPSLALAQATR
ncbi:CPCC family cysteine-rich protein [Breznakiellaceae bacterium SP9]